MTVSIVKTNFAATDLSCFRADLDDDAAGGEEEIEADIRAMTRQRNHTTRTANRAYANLTNARLWEHLGLPDPPESPGLKRRTASGRGRMPTAAASSGQRARGCSIVLPWESKIGRAHV